MTSEIVPIRSLAQIRAGYQTRTGVETSPEGTHALVQLRDFDESRTSLDCGNLALIEPGAINPVQVLQEGDVLFLAKGAKNFAFAPIGLPKPSLAASYFFILRPDARILPPYLAWFLNLYSTKRLFSQFSGFSAHMPVVRRDVIEEILVPLPALETQTMIVELDALGRRQQDLLAELARAQHALHTAICKQLASQSTPIQIHL